MPDVSGILVAIPFLIIKDPLLCPQNNSPLISVRLQTCPAVFGINLNESVDLCFLKKSPWLVPIYNKSSWSFEEYTVPKKPSLSL